MIEIKNLSRSYGEIAAVDDVTFTVESGEFVVLVGTSGSGKTTLLRMINRLVEPSSGKVLIDGEDTQEIQAHILRRRIGYVIQGNGLFPHRTVAQNIATVPRLMGWPKDEISARVDELLALFQLDPKEFRNRMPHELSGGQQQRVGVARGLAARPDLMLMDEPFGALDPVIRGRAQMDLLATQRKLNTTMILVTHDMEEAIRLGHKIAVMDKGKLVQFATPAEILTRPATPFVEGLIGTDERPLRLMSLDTVSSLVSEGEASGQPISASASLRDALSECLWSGRRALPVSEGGIVTLDALIRHAGPAERLPA